MTKVNMIPLVPDSKPQIPMWNGKPCTCCLSGEEIADLSSWAWTQLHKHGRYVEIYDQDYDAYVIFDTMSFPVQHWDDFQREVSRRIREGKPFKIWREDDSYKIASISPVKGAETARFLANLLDKEYEVLEK